VSKIFKTAIILNLGGFAQEFPVIHNIVETSLVCTKILNNWGDEFFSDFEEEPHEILIVSVEIDQQFEAQSQN